MRKIDHLHSMRLWPKSKSQSFRKDRVNENLSLVIMIFTPFAVFLSGLFFFTKASYFEIASDVNIFNQSQDIVIRVIMLVLVMSILGLFWYGVCLLCTSKNECFRTLTYFVSILIMWIYSLPIKLYLYKLKWIIGLIQLIVLLIGLLLVLSRVPKRGNSTLLYKYRDPIIRILGCCVIMMVLEVTLSYFCMDLNNGLARDCLVTLVFPPVGIRGVIGFLYLTIVPGFIFSLLLLDRPFKEKIDYIKNRKIADIIEQFKVKFFTVGSVIKFTIASAILVIYFAFVMTITQSVYKFDRPIDNKKNYPIECYVVVWEDNNQYCLEPAVVDNDGLRIYTSVNQWVSKEDVLTYKSNISIKPEEINRSNQLPKEMWSVRYTKKSIT